MLLEHGVRFAGIASQIAVAAVMGASRLKDSLDRNDVVRVFAPPHEIEPRLFESHVEGRCFLSSSPRRKPPSGAVLWIALKVGQMSLAQSTSAPGLVETVEMECDDG